MADETYNPFPNQAPPRPPDPPAPTPETPLEVAVDAFVESLTPSHQRSPAMSVLTVELRKTDLRDAVKTFAESLLADLAINTQVAQLTSELAAAVKAQGEPYA